MKKIVLSALAISAFVACTTGSLNKQIVGEYDAAMKIEVKDTTDQMEQMMASMMSSLKFEMDFEADGKLEMSMSRGEESMTEPMTWEVKGDSIMLTDKSNTIQAFMVTKTDKGFDFVNPDLTFELTKKAEEASK